MEKQTCIVVGGGLAGLVAARNLARAGWDVTLLEKQSYVGGKAAAVDMGAPVPIEHGYHVFPRWYENIRGMLEDINGEFGTLSDTERPKGLPPKLELLDFDGYYYLKPGGEYVKMHGPSGWGAIYRNIFDNFMPPHVQLLYVFSVIDMLRTRMDRRSMLDGISQIGFIRDRFYATEDLAKLNQENILKASAIPAYEMSTMTAKNVASYWIPQSNPFVSILPGNLQDWFINPIAESAKRAGVKIRLKAQVAKLNIGYEQIEGQYKPVMESVALRRVNGSEAEETLEADAYVLATPLEVTRKMISDEVYEADPELGNIQHIEAEPMSALHLFIDQTPEKLGLNEAGTNRPEHIFLTGSHYGLSFIDNSQSWEEIAEKGAYLSFIASNFSPLREVSEAVAKELLLDEIEEYIPKLDRTKITQAFLNPNVGQPLYINTVGSWANRPRTDSAIDNLFLAGDYVKNPVDLACMEGAVSSGIEAAHLLTRQRDGRLNPADTTDLRPLTKWSRRLSSMLSKAREPLPEPTELQPVQNPLTRWSEKVSSVLRDERKLRDGVAPPAKVPVTWPRGVYQAAYYAAWVPAFLLARAKGEDTKIDYSRVKQAANTRFRPDDYDEKLEEGRRALRTPTHSEIRDLDPNRASDERDTG